MATLYKRNDSPFWWIHFTPSEKMLLGLENTSTKKRAKADAEQVLWNYKSIIIDKKRAGTFSHKKPGSIRLSDMFEKFKTDRQAQGRELKAGTLDLYKMAFKYFYTVVDDKPVQEYGRSDYYDFVELLQRKQLAINTQAMLTNRIAALFNWMLKEGYIEATPMKTIAEQKKLLEIVPDGIIKVFMEYASTTKFYLFSKFMLLSAFRAQEALDFTTDNIKPGIITIYGKGNKQATIPIYPELEDFIITELIANEDGRFFPFQYQDIRRFFQRASAKINYKIVSHDLRKYCLSKMANNGVNIYFVKNFARHTKIETTLKYYAGVDNSKMINEIDSKVNFSELFPS